MAFNSYGFILAFLPAFLILYYTLGKWKAWAPAALIIAGGVVFYLHAGWESFAVLCVSVLVNFLLAAAMSRTARQKPLLVGAICFNVLLLFCFKYLTFALEALQPWVPGSLIPRNVILPLGISFFTFQQIMYVSSVFRGETAVHLIDYLAYILYFPKLLMGPLMEPAPFLQQLHDPCRKKLNWENLALGIRLFSFGLFKKMLLADTFARAVSWGAARFHADPWTGNLITSYDLLIIMLCYTFQIYFDFSGYSDMAVGISKMMSIDLPMNFDSPYRALSIQDFWKRWHISLTRFLTRYIYIPLGGNQRGKGRTYVHILIVFLVSGIWHGANWTFLLWGGLHGLLQVLERAAGKALRKIPRPLRWLGTFLCVNVLWLLFQAESVSEWLLMLQCMFSLKYRILSDGLLRCFDLPELRFLWDSLRVSGLLPNVNDLNLWIFLLFSLVICLLPKHRRPGGNWPPVLDSILCAILFVWSLLCLSSESLFVYFNF